MMKCDCLFDTDDDDNNLDSHADGYNNHVYYDYLGMTIILIITL
jgi:hypothetical protein